jgi:hypothetical protein
LLVHLPILEFLSTRLAKLEFQGRGSMALKLHHKSSMSLNTIDRVVVLHIPVSTLVVHVSTHRLIMDMDVDTAPNVTAKEC